MARMRAVASVAGSGAFGLAEQETSTATAAAIRPRRACLIRPLAPHRPLALQNSVQRGPRFLRQVIGLFIRRILSRSHIGAEGLHCARNGRAHVRVPPYELCRMPKAEIENVVEDQHLAVAIRSSADTNGRSLDLGGNHGRDFSRD